MCFKCGLNKALSDYYKHPRMLDGYLNKCKSCTKSDVSGNRLQKIDFYREYDRERGNRQGYDYVKEYREKYPLKKIAHQKVQRAIRNGSLIKQNCEECGAIDTHAHHDDYLFPLTIRWLCPVHHKKWHIANGPGLNHNSSSDLY